MQRAAWGFGTDSDLAWMDRGTCLRHDPEWWVGEGTASNHGLARHLCQEHCPVLHECAAYASEHPDMHAGTLIGGVLYVHPRNTGLAATRPATHQPEPLTCWRGCPEWPHPVEAIPVAAELANPTSATVNAPAPQRSNLRPCGTPSAAARHRAHGEQPCPECAEAMRQYQRQRKAIQRSAGPVNPDADDPVSAIERARETWVRDQTCPSCGAVPGAACEYDVAQWALWSHTSRYDRAAAQGLVPPLPTPPTSIPDGVAA